MENHFPYHSFFKLYINNLNSSLKDEIFAPDRRVPKCWKKMIFWKGGGEWLKCTIFTPAATCTKWLRKATKVFAGIKNRKWPENAPFSSKFIKQPIFPFLKVWPKFNVRCSCRPYFKKKGKLAMASPTPSSPCLWTFRYIFTATSFLNKKNRNR